MASRSPHMYERVTAERKQLIEALWECMKQAGADTSYADSAEHAYALGESGHPPFTQAVIEAVKELRQDYELAPMPEELHQAEAELKTAASHRERLEAVLNELLRQVDKIAERTAGSGPNAHAGVHDLAYHAARRARDALAHPQEEADRG